MVFIKKEKKLRPDRGGATIKPFKNRYCCQYDFEIQIYIYQTKLCGLVLGGDPELAIQRSLPGNLKLYPFVETGSRLHLAHR